MKKIHKIKVITITITMVCIVSLCYFKSEKIYSSELDKKDILVNIEKNYDDNDFDEEYISKAKKYMNTLRKDSDYYFILGYFDYIANDYENAIENFELAKKNISSSSSIFVKVYNYILLNHCLIEVENYESIVENCKSSFEYIGSDEKYKNNKAVIWEGISTLLNNVETSADSVEILNSYITNTRGLKDECKIPLKGNLAFLYTLDAQYSESIYQCLEMIDIIDENPGIQNGDVYKVKAYIIIGNIYFSLYNYDDAIDIYNVAINFNVEDKNKEYVAKCDAYINIVHSYIETKQYDKAINLSEEMMENLKYMDDYAKDDIEILINNNLALVNIYEHDFNSAKQRLEYCQELLKNDKQEFSLNKDIFITLSYAKLFKEEKRYDEALKVYKYTLDKSIESGVGINFEIYEDIVDIHKLTGDLNNYINYSERLLEEGYKFINEADKKYINYSFKSYENEKLKLERDEEKTRGLVLFFLSILLIFFIVLKSRKIKALNKSNYIDGMSKLYNRKFLEYYIKKNKRYLKDREFAIALIDIDYFKTYNDNYGHVKGDEVIKGVSKAICDNIRKNDIAIRYGGEEFLLILDTSSITILEQIVNRIEKNIKDDCIEHKYSEVKDRITVSMGIYIKKRGTDEYLYDSIDKGDKALYIAKNNGRNRYEWFEGE